VYRYKYWEMLGDSEWVRVNAFLPRRLDFALSVLTEASGESKSLLLAYMVNHTFLRTARQYGVKNPHELLNAAYYVEKCVEEVKHTLKPVPPRRVTEKAAKLARKNHVR